MGKLVVLILITTVGQSRIHHGLEINYETYHGQLYRPIQAIVEKYFLYSRVLILADEENALQLGLLIRRCSDLPLNLLAGAISHISRMGMRRTEHCVILVNDLRRLDSTMESLSKLPGWNPRGKFVVAVRSCFTNVTDVFEGSLRKRVMNIVLVTCSSSTNFLGDIEEVTCSFIMVYTYFPYGNNVCNGSTSVVTIDVWRDDSFMQNRELFPSKVSNLYQCHLTISTADRPPSVFLDASPDGEFEIGGTDGVFVNYLSQGMNFKPRITVIKDEYLWGYVCDNGTVTGVQGDVFHGRADVAIFQFGVTIGLSALFDWSKPWTEEMIVWVVPKAGLIPLWIQVYLPYEIPVWICFLVSFLLSMAFLKIFHKVSSTSKTFNNFFLSLLSIVLNMSYSHYPDSVSSKLFLAFWLYGSLVLSTGYQSSLFCFLTHPMSYREVDTMDQLLESDLQVGGLQFFRDEIFSDSTTPASRQIYQSWIIEENYFSRIAKGMDFASVASYSDFEYFESDFMDRHGNPVLHAASETILSYPVTYLLSKGSPFLEAVNNVTVRVIEAGLKSKVERDIMANKTLHRLNRSGRARQDDRTVLSLYHLEGAFILFFTNLFISCFFFILEFLSFRLRLQCARKE